MAKKYIVDLTDDERAKLKRLLQGGKARVRRATRCASCCWPTRA